MRLWTTEIRAICPIFGVLLTWGGRSDPGLSPADAMRYCQQNGLGYCKVVGELVAEIPCKEGEFEADLERMENFEFLN